MINVQPTGFSVIEVGNDAEHAFFDLASLVGGHGSGHLSGHAGCVVPNLAAPLFNGEDFAVWKHCHVAGIGHGVIRNDVHDVEFGFGGHDAGLRADIPMESEATHGQNNLDGV